MRGWKENGEEREGRREGGRAKGRVTEGVSERRLERGVKEDGEGRAREGRLKRARGGGGRVKGWSCKSIDNFTWAAFPIGNRVDV